MTSIVRLGCLARSGLTLLQINVSVLRTQREVPRRSLETACEVSSMFSCLCANQPKTIAAKKADSLVMIYLVRCYLFLLFPSVRGLVPASSWMLHMHCESHTSTQASQFNRLIGRVMIFVIFSVFRFYSTFLLKIIISLWDLHYVSVLTSINHYET
jgi:hypothetical protein